MRLDELKDDNLAWDGLQADLSLQDIPGWLKRFVSSGLCGHRYQGDAFYASSNAMATWVDSLADLLQRKISETAKDNNSSMREALVRLKPLVESVWESEGGEDVSSEIAEMKDVINAALAAPMKNCEVGTWQEQEKRFEQFCNRFRHDYCRGCPLGEMFFRDKEIGECRLAWAQRLYDGDKKEGAA